MNKRGKGKLMIRLIAFYILAFCSLAFSSDCPKLRIRNDFRINDEIKIHIQLEEWGHLLDSLIFSKDHELDCLIGQIGTIRDRLEKEVRSLHRKIPLAAQDSLHTFISRKSLDFSSLLLTFDPDLDTYLDSEYISEVVTNLMNSSQYIDNNTTPKKADITYQINAETAVVLRLFEIFELLTKLDDKCPFYDVYDLCFHNDRALLYLDEVVLPHLIAQVDEYKEYSDYSEYLNTFVKEKIEYIDPVKANELFPLNHSKNFR